MGAPLSFRTRLPGLCWQNESSATTDEALATEAAHGNRIAFDELVARYQGPLFQLARIMVGTEAEAEDILHGTFVRAHRTISTFGRRDTFRTWIYRMAFDILRTHAGYARARSMHERAMVAAYSERDWSRPDLEDALVRRELIDRALTRLPGSLRMLVILHDILGLDPREVGTVTGLPIRIVESRIRQGRRLLRPMLAPLIARARQLSAHTRAQSRPLQRT